jgi:hypothetical protein
MQSPIALLNSLAARVFGRDPEKAEHRAGNWSGYATLAILVGIILEILSELAALPRAVEWRTTYAVTADALIGLGLVIEYICIRATIVASAEIKRQSDEKLTEALDRASAAETELIKFRMPRRKLFSPEAKKAVADLLRPFAGTPFDIGFGDGDGEQADCAWDIEEVLTVAGWSQIAWGVHAVGILTIHRNLRPLAGSVGAQNIEVQMEPSWRQGRLPAAEALIAALNSIGVDAAERPYNTANTNVQAIHVLIGPKR